MPVAMVQIAFFMYLPSSWPSEIQVFRMWPDPQHERVQQAGGKERNCLPIHPTNPIPRNGQCESYESRILGKHFLRGGWGSDESVVLP